jgi:hypothetical protein
VSHAMSHHLYTNTVLDLEIAMLEQFIILQELESIPCNESSPVHKYGSRPGDCHA